MTAVGLFVGLSVPVGATGYRLFRSCLSDRTPLEAANPSISWCRSVAQPGSAPDLGTVVPAANSGAFSIASHASESPPWYSAWDFLRAGMIPSPRLQGANPPLTMNTRIAAMIPPMMVRPIHFSVPWTSLTPLPT